MFIFINIYSYIYKLSLYIQSRNIEIKETKQNKGKSCKVTWI